MYVLKRAKSHHCVVNTSGTFACNFSMFLKGAHVRKSLTESERSDRF